MSLPYGPPVEVSPLIRGFRWAFLIAGVFYGITKHQIYKGIEAERQQKLAEKKIIKDKEMEILKAQIAKDEAEALRQIEKGEYPLFK